MNASALPKHAWYYSLAKHGTQWVLVRGHQQKGRLQFETIYSGSNLQSLDENPTIQVKAELATGKALLVSGIPSSQSLARHLVTPFGSLKKAGKVFPGLLDIQIPFPVEQCTCAFTGQVARSDAVQALAVAARNETLDQFVGNLSDQHLPTASMDHEALAIWDRVRSEQQQQDALPFITCMVSPDETLLVLGSSDRFIASATLSTGTTKLQSPDKDEQTHAQQRWLSGINQYLQAWHNHYLQEGFAWLWGNWDPNLQDRLSQLALELTVQPSTSSMLDDPQTLTARAFLSRSLQPGAWHCNLLIGQHEHPAVRKQQERSAGKASATMLVAGLLLFGAGFAQQQLVTSPKKQLDEVIRTKATSLAGIQAIPYGQEVLIVSRILKDKASRTTAFRHAYEQTVTTQLKDLLAASHSSIALQNLELNNLVIKIDGSSSAGAHCDEFKSNLEALGFQTQMERKPAGPDGNLFFTMEASPRS